MYFSFYNKRLISINPYRPPKPFFWTARLSVDYAAFVGVEKTFFSYKKYFSLSYGVSVGVLGTNSKNIDNINVISLYAISRIYVLSLDSFRLFILYSPGGPSLLSKRAFSDTKFSNSFVFQNQLGLGFDLGSSKQFSVLLKIYHFSNGDLFAINGGIDTPLLLGLGLKI
jgi:hypothetical protein